MTRRQVRRGHERHEAAEEEERIENEKKYCEELQYFYILLCEF